MISTSTPRQSFVYTLEDETGTPFYVGCAHDVKRPEEHIVAFTGVEAAVDSEIITESERAHYEAILGARWRR